MNYEEKEWRYTIPYSEHEWIFSQEKYDEWRGDVHKKRPKPTDKLIKHTLKFGIEDVEAIYIPREKKQDLEELKEYVRKLHQIGGRGSELKEGDKETLISKIKFLSK